MWFVTILSLCSPWLDSLWLLLASMGAKRQSFEGHVGYLWIQITLCWLQICTIVEFNAFDLKVFFFFLFIKMYEHSSQFLYVLRMKNSNKFQYHGCS